jgi:hypothetical protein
MSFVIDFAMYLVLAGAAFAFVVWLWRRVFREVDGRLERFLFWGTWIGLSIMLAGTYHVATGDRAFGRSLMLLALVEAVVVLVGVNIGAAAMFRKPYDPEQDPEFMAELEERRRLHEEGFQRYLADLRSGRVLPTERRQLR